MNTLTPQEVWQQMTELTSQGEHVYNYTAHIRMDNWVVETDLFPADALNAYSAWNLEKPISEDTRKTYFTAYRGGSQGDYRAGMGAKIRNVVDCLTRFPQSKRAVITISNRPDAPHTSDDDAKCMREIHFHLDGNQLNATVFFRAAAADIFPKNIHFIGELMAEVARNLGPAIHPGDLFYLTSILVADRS